MHFEIHLATGRKKGWKRVKGGREGGEGWEACNYPPFKENIPGRNPGESRGPTD